MKNVGGLLVAVRYHEYDTITNLYIAYSYPPIHPPILYTSLLLVASFSTYHSCLFTALFCLLFFIRSSTFSFCFLVGVVLWFGLVYCWVDEWMDGWERKRGGGGIIVHHVEVSFLERKRELKLSSKS